jgi:hypothetical protein
MKKLKQSIAILEEFRNEVLLIDIDSFDIEDKFDEFSDIIHVNQLDINRIKVNV